MAVSNLDEVIAAERSKLGSFIRRHVADPGDAEDILQDVFYELVVAYRLMKPIENAGAWLFRVARNRIIDLFRKKQPARPQPEPDDLPLEDWLPSAEAGPEAEFARSVLLAEIEDALAELPEEQREVFLAHEVEGIPFQEIAARTGTNLNTLLSRKRYAVQHLRRRLQSIYNEGAL